MNLDEVIGEVIESSSSRVIAEFAGESIGYASVTTHLCTDGPVLTFNVRSADVLRIRAAADMAHVNADALCRRIARFIFEHRTIDFLQYRVVNFHSEGVLNSFKIRPMAVGCDLYPIA